MEEYIGSIGKVFVNTNKEKTKKMVSTTLTVGDVVELEDGTVEDRSKSYRLSFTGAMGDLAQLKLKDGVDVKVVGTAGIHKWTDKETQKERVADKITVSTFKVLEKK